MTTALQAVSPAQGNAAASIETGRPNTDRDAQAAYDQLMKMAEELAASGKYQSVASAFAAVFTDQANAELAARAHQRPNAVRDAST